MTSNFEDALGNFDDATLKLYKSDKVTEVLDFLANLTQDSGNGRGEEPALNEALRKTKEELQKARKASQKLNSEINGYESNYVSLLKEKEAVEAAIEEKLNERIPCKEDEDTLNKSRHDLRLYKDITGIRWDYSAPESIAKGYVCGGIKNYVSSFELPLDDYSTDRLWQEIENASLRPSTDFKGKENVKQKS